MTENSIYFIVIGIYLLVLAPDFIKLFKLIKRPSVEREMRKQLVKVNLVVLVFGLILFVSLLVFEVNIFNYSKPIPYADIGKISLKDFNGLKVPGFTLQGGEEFAFITSNIEYEIDKDGITVTSFFHPARSYVYIDDLESEELLTHELYHFHITELNARYFRKKISIFETPLIRKEINLIFNEINQGLMDMQRAYDYETDHGYLLGKQLEWQAKVDSLLEAYGTYSETKIKFSYGVNK